MIRSLKQGEPDPQRLLKRVAEQILVGIFLGLACGCSDLSQRCSITARFVEHDHNNDTAATVCIRSSETK
jgi:hypothetical protein